MAYYGRGPGPITNMFPGGQGPVNPQMYGNHGPPGPQHPGMFQQQGQFNEYNESNAQPPYGQQQGYFEHLQAYDSGQSESVNSGAGHALDPRLHGMQMQQTNPGTFVRQGPTKILRNPYPEVSKEMKLKEKESYDPSCPTGPSTSGPSIGARQYNQQRIAPPPPIISSMSSVCHSQTSMPVTMSSAPGFHPPAPTFNNGPMMGSGSGNMGMDSAGMYSNGMYGNGSNHSQTQPAPVVLPANYQLPFQGTSGGGSSGQQESQSKLQVMTGIVTQVQPGAFGMVSEEIFFQESVVSGPLPKLGDKVVVEAEPVKGMPFKYNAKRVTKLDMDLEKKNASPAPSSYQQQALSQQYQHLQPRHQQQHYQNPEPTLHYQPDRPPMMDDPATTFEPPNFGPLPSLPDSLNLPRPVPPPNLASVLPSSGNSNAPLKSILKRKGSPSLKRNPPPPPVISKNKGKEDANPFLSSAPSSLKQNKFAVDLNRDVPRVLPPQGSGPPIEFPEYTFFNKDRLRRAPSPDPPAAISPRITRLLPQSPPFPDFDNNRKSDSVDEWSANRRRRSRSRDRTSPPKGYKSRSKSPVGRFKRRSRSRSISPRRSRRSRSRSPSPNRRRRYSRSPCHRSRSVSPRSRRRRSRSLSKDRRSESRGRRNYRSRRSRSRTHSRSPYRSRPYSRSPYRSRSHSRSPYRSKQLPDGHRSSSPQSSGLKVLGETVTHGIVVKRVSSDLFPKLIHKAGEIREANVIRGDGKGKVCAFSNPATKTSTPPVPVKFQIANPAKPTSTAASAMVPNPTFRAAGTSVFLQNPVHNITKTVINPLADVKGKKKKSKEQEPAFRVIEKDNEQPKEPATKTMAEEKIKQWEEERQALKSKIVKNITSAADNLLKNPVNILQLKQTIQNDLLELRSKGESEPGKKLLENPVDILKLKQTVQRDLEELKTKEATLSTLPGAKEKNPLDSGMVVVDKNFDENVEKRLKELRSKFETHIKEAKASASTEPPKKPATTTTKPSAEPLKPNSERQNDLSTGEKDKTRVSAPSPGMTGKQPSENFSGRSKGPPKRHERSPPIELPPYDEHMERLQEEIHRQRFLEEEQRLKCTGDENGLHQLYFMEDRRRRRIDERHLARIRMTEIKLKKEKNFGELARLREEWGPPAQRLEHEKELRQRRTAEERQENHLQTEAIRRQEYEYQQWLEEEAAARSRSMKDSARASRGCEGRVLRRRTPSPSSRRNPPPPESHHGPNPSRRHSRSPSFERYKDDWHRRHPRDRSPMLSYEQFVMRYPIGPPPPHPMHSMPGGRFPPGHPDFHGPGPMPPHLDQDGFFISRAMDDVARRQDELMHREMEIQRRIEMAQRRFNGGPPPSHRGGRGTNREEVRRFVVPRR